MSLNKRSTRICFKHLPALSTKEVIDFTAIHLPFTKSFDEAKLTKKFDENIFNEPMSEEL